MTPDTAFERDFGKLALSGPIRLAFVAALLRAEQSQATLVFPARGRVEAV